MSVTADSRSLRTEEKRPYNRSSSYNLFSCVVCVHVFVWKCTEKLVLGLLSTKTKTHRVGNKHALQTQCDRIHLVQPSCCSCVNCSAVY